MEPQSPQIRNAKEVNILLLGETGCGKSTWINAISNYLRYDSLAAAKPHPLTFLIPSYFVIQTHGAEYKQVKIGRSPNENCVEGQAATQSPQRYTFMHNSTLIRMIDTPGMCDTRGLEQDKENFKLILDELQTITELHAICILLPPDNARLTTAFQYCLNELLTHLHTSAAKNIIFCFTKTRGTLNRAGQTLATLTAYLEKLAKYRNIKILPSDDTMYYLDNEAFRFLCALKEGIQFGENENAIYEKSWTNAAEQTVRFLDYVLTLKPHLTRYTVSMNEARRIILSLTGPLTKIVANIETNLRLLEIDKKEIQQLDVSEEELKTKLYIQQLALVAKPVAVPRFVCASQKCIELVPLPNSNLKAVRYKQTCHDDRVVKAHKRLDVGPELGINEEGWSGEGNVTWEGTKKQPEFCRTCGCDWSAHMYFCYEQELEEVTVIDSITENLLEAIGTRKIQKEDVCAARDRQIAILQQRHERITEICAYFGAFMHYNSYVPYNDVFVQNQEELIRVAKHEASLDTSLLQKVEDLERHLTEYNKKVGMVKNGLENGTLRIMPDDITKMKLELYAMNSPDCNVPSYLQIAEEANDERCTAKDHFFETDSNVVNQIRRKKKPCSTTSAAAGASKNPDYYDAVLIDIVQRCPILYDSSVSSRNYTTRVKETWSIVATEMNRRGFKTEPGVCQNRWKILKDTFLTEHKKVTHSRPGFAPVTSAWPHFQRMVFLTQHIVNNDQSAGSGTSGVNQFAIQVSEPNDTPSIASSKKSEKPASSPAECCLKSMTNALRDLMGNLTEAELSRFHDELIGAASKLKEKVKSNTGVTASRQNFSQQQERSHSKKWQ